MPRCPMCIGSTQTPVWGTVRRCQTCGLVFRPPDSTLHQYHRDSWAGTDCFEENAEALADYLTARVPAENVRRVVEVGPGPGFLAERLTRAYPGAEILLVESSPDVAALVAHRVPRAVVLCCPLEIAPIEAGTVDLLLACGVDYLFPDLRQGYKVLQALLAPGGIFYAERNVWADSRRSATALYATEVECYTRNPMMTTWFPTREAYLAWIAQWVRVQDWRKFDLNGSEGLGCLGRQDLARTGAYVC